MGTLTRSGIAYNLSNSPYYSVRNGFRFYFSSNLHKVKFDSEVRLKEEWLQDSFFRRFKVAGDFSLLADFQLYIRLETRGFYVVNLSNGEVYTCREEVLLGGLVARKIDLEKQSEITMRQLLG